MKEMHDSLERSVLAKQTTKQYAEATIGDQAVKGAHIVLVQALRQKLVTKRCIADGCTAMFRFEGCMSLFLLTSAYSRLTATMLS
jgi:hypothetical protein